jgi:hypothetical protein
MFMKKGYIAFEVSDKSRTELSAIFRPIYSKWIGHHVTYKFGTTDAKVIGYANSGDGVECLVVKINGTSVRPDGGTYHITWSLSANRKPVESNNLLKDKGYTVLVNPIDIQVVPKFYAF